jgi:hypothetical protein
MNADQTETKTIKTAQSGSLTSLFQIRVHPRKSAAKIVLGLRADQHSR